MCHRCLAQIFRRIAKRGHDLNRKLCLCLLSCWTPAGAHHDDGLLTPAYKAEVILFPKFVCCLVPLVSANIRTPGKTKDESIETILPKLWAENSSSLRSRRLQVVCTHLVTQVGGHHTCYVLCLACMGNRDHHMTNVRTRISD